MDIYSKYRDLLPRERVNELSKLKPSIVIRDTIISWSIIITAFIIIYFYTIWWVVLLMIPIVGSTYYSLFIIGHDGMHQRLFKEKKTNDLFCDVFIFGFIGAITRINKTNHLNHHRYLSTEMDPDRYKYSCVGKETTITVFFFLAGFQTFYNTFINVLLKKHEQSINPNPEKIKYKIRDIIILLFCQLLLIGGLTYFIGWWAYPILWLLPFYIFTFCADNFRAFSEHSHPENNSLADQHRLITFLPNRIEKFFFAPLNMHYHVVHHLWPSIPYYNLGVANMEMMQNKKAASITVRKSYLSYLSLWVKSIPTINCK